MAMRTELYETVHRRSPAWLRELVRTGATRVGCRIGRLPSMESLGSHLLAIFRQLDINCVLDVGAHVGQYGRFLRNIGYTGHIVSFEPVRANFDLLEQQSAGDRCWSVFRLALGERHGMMPINVARVTQFSSFLLPNRYSLDQFGGFSEVDRTEVVEMQRLEDIFNACVSRVSDPHVFLKMDTQGYDLKVVAGAGRCMKHVRALQSELAVKPIYGEMTGYATATADLAELGFELSGVFPVCRDAQMRIVELDCVMVRSAPDAS